VIIPPQPGTKLPSGACDCHVHIYGDPTVYPASPHSPAMPMPEATVEAYRALQARLGLERVVVVQPSAYGFDNRCTLDAIRQLGAGARGVVVLRPEAGEAELEACTEQGARGVRFLMLEGGVTRWEELGPVAARVAPFGWHVQLQMDGRLLPEREIGLKRLPCPLVIDHNGKFLRPVDVGHPGFLSLCRLLDTGRVWVKTSACYETSREGPPRYGDVARLAQALIRRFPERVVWGTNWPHPSKRLEPPDDALLLDLVAEWAGGEDVLERIMVVNPAKLYGFN
jgi:D-galactarolactone isomerase